MNKILRGNEKKYKKDEKKREERGRQVTTCRRGRSPHSYLGRPWRRCWWRTWSWGSGCRRRGKRPAPPRSAAPCSRRCRGRSTATGSEPRRCRGDTAGWRTACKCTLYPRGSPWSCDPGGTCAEKRWRRAEAWDAWEAVWWTEHWILQSYEATAVCKQIPPELEP